MHNYYGELSLVFSPACMCTCALNRKPSEYSFDVGLVKGFDVAIGSAQSMPPPQLAW